MVLFVVDVGGEDGRVWVGCVGHAMFLWNCLWDLCEMRGKVEHVSTIIMWWMPIHKVAFHIHFELSAKAHSPDVLLAICSYGLRPRTWIGSHSEVSLPTEEMSCILQLLSKPFPVSGLALLSSRRNVPLRLPFHATKTSRTHLLHPRHIKGE